MVKLLQVPTGMLNFARLSVVVGMVALIPMGCVAPAKVRSNSMVMVEPALPTAELNRLVLIPSASTLRAFMGSSAFDGERENRQLGNAMIEEFLKKGIQAELLSEERAFESTADAALTISINSFVPRTGDAEFDLTLLALPDRKVMMKSTLALQSVNQGYSTVALEIVDSLVDEHRHLRPKAK